jgi:hypothetical protein
MPWLKSELPLSYAPGLVPQVNVAVSPHTELAPKAQNKTIDKTQAKMFFILVDLIWRKDTAFFRYVQI